MGSEGVWRYWRGYVNAGGRAGEGMTKETTDYNAKLAQDYADISAKVRGGMLPLVARIPAIEKAVSAYVLAQDAHYEELRRKAETGGGVTPEAVPIQLRDATALHRMADLILHEELTWSHPDKMSIVEYPVMSDRQTQTYYEGNTHKGDLKFGDLRFLGRRKTVVERKDGSHGVSFNRVLNEGNGEEDAADARIDVQRALDSAGLTDRQREAIELVYFGNDGEGMTQEEAGEIMGISQKNVNKHLRYGLAKIKRKVDV